MRWRLAEAMAWAWSAPMAPSRQASAHRGQVAQRPPEAHPALGGARGTRQRVAIHAAAVLAPSAAHSSPASKAAVASVTKDSKRDEQPVQLLDRRAVAVVRRARRDQCLECFGEVRPTPCVDGSTRLSQIAARTQHGRMH